MCEVAGDERLRVQVYSLPPCSLQQLLLSLLQAVPVHCQPCGDSCAAPVNACDFLGEWRDGMASLDRMKMSWLMSNVLSIPLYSEAGWEVTW